MSFSGHGGAQLALAATGKVLADHEHVHVRVRRIDGVDRPLPDGPFEHRRREGPLLRRALARDLHLRLQRGEIEILGECFVERRFQRQRWPFIGDVSHVILRNGADHLARHRQTPNAEREQHTHAHDLSLHDIPVRFVRREAHVSTSKRNRE